MQTLAEIQDEVLRIADNAQKLSDQWQRIHPEIVPPDGVWLRDVQGLMEKFAKSEQSVAERLKTIIRNIEDHEKASLERIHEKELAAAQREHPTPSVEVYPPKINFTPIIDVNPAPVNIERQPALHMIVAFGVGIIVGLVIANC